MPRAGFESVSSVSARLVETRQLRANPSRYKRLHRAFVEVCRLPPKRQPDSTSWGSLVRAQYRPPHRKPRSSAAFVVSEAIIVRTPWLPNGCNRTRSDGIQQLSVNAAVIVNVTPTLFLLVAVKNRVEWVAL